MPTEPITEHAITRTERLDRLPFTKAHRKLLVGSGLGWALDAMDVGLLSYVLVALAASWEITPTEQSWLATISALGMAIGASLGGLLADKVGRRQVFAVTLLIFGIATGLSALAWGVGVLLVLRFIVGLGLGAELPVASTLVSEMAPSRIRGRIVVILEAFWAVGWLASALIGAFIVPTSENGWRWALAIGLIPAIYAAIVRFGLPESVRFLEAKGRHIEAESVVRDFEASAGIEQGGITEPAAAAPASAERTTGTAEPATLGARQRLAALFSTRLRGRTIPLWVVWFCVNFSYYGAFIWLPTILFNSGYPLVRSVEFTLIITLAQLPGYAVAAWLIEKWGRRATLSVFLAGSAVSAMLFGTAATDTTVLLFGCLLSFFNLGAWGALYAITPELFPTRLRATGAGWAAAVGRIGAILAPLSVPVLSAAGGNGLLFGVFGVFFLIATVGALFLAEKRGQSLEEE
ncbi:MFS transporter [Diaminobutyricimonas sp. LJ205]|uniref:MFS transporter n=1 Tax=Diaminobutyricimonas sp. LJ205 TaxID=2683590 RepID=UPI0012F4CD91|nr:MFS transporter [Diaminobutyricimonas sp. LJ205]